MLKYDLRTLSKVVTGEIDIFVDKFGRISRNLVVNDYTYLQILHYVRQNITYYPTRWTASKAISTGSG